MIGFVFVPLLIAYLKPTKYGIWITLSSLITWVGFFDLGLGHGLRNRLAESLAKDDYVLGRTFVSTTYALISMIMFGIFAVYNAINPFLHWNKILNTSNSDVSPKELSLLAYFVITFFCFRFIFQLITTILKADQRSALASVFDLAAKILSLLAILIIIKISYNDLLLVGIAISVAPVIILLVSNIYFFNGRYAKLCPSLKFVNFKMIPSILTLGLKFFFIQLSILVLYQTNAIIISNLFGPENVTPYSVTLTLFSGITMFHSIIITPYWSAITEAWQKNELVWITNTMKMLNKFVVVSGFFIVIVVISFKFLLKIWLKNTIQVSNLMIILIAMWVFAKIWEQTQCTFLNGVGKINLQLFLTVTTAVLHIPLALVLAKYLKSEGIILSVVFFATLRASLYKYQNNKILCKQAQGIWNS